QAEQDGLGLVVAGVGEQDGRGVMPLGRLAQGGAAGLSGGRLGPAAGRDPDPAHLDRVRAEPPGLAGGGGRDLVGAGLQPVVDDDGAAAQSGPGRLEAGGGEQGQRVGAAGQPDEDHGPGVEVAQRRPDGPPGVGDHGGEPGATAVGAHAPAPGTYPWTRRSQAAGSAISAALGSCSGADQTALNPSIPTSSMTALTNAAPSEYCRILASRPSSRRSSRSACERPLRRLSNRARIVATDGI